MADKYIEELKRYIQNQVRKGYDKEIVVKHLLKSGISRRQIAEAAYDVKPKKKEQAVSPETQSLESRFRESLGTKVNLYRNQKGRGRLVIHFYSEEELQNIYDVIIGSG